MVSKIMEYWSPVKMFKTLESVLRQGKLAYMFQYGLLLTEKGQNTSPKFKTLPNFEAKAKIWQMIPFSFSHLSTQPALQCRWTVCQFLARSPLWSGVRPPRQEFTTLLPNIENNPSSLFHLFAKLFCNPSSPPQSSIRAAFRQVSKHHQQLLSKVRNQKSKI